MTVILFLTLCLSMFTPVLMDDGNQQCLEWEKSPQNCLDALKQGYNVSGVYLIQPELAPEPFLVLCDQETDGGGWTHIHKRTNGVQNFEKKWKDYKLGFGNLGADFWLGLEHIYELTGLDINELLIELRILGGVNVNALYAAFGISNEEEGYALRILRGYTGTAGDSLSYHGGSKFSTLDNDQDDWEKNCAEEHRGGWWFRNCQNSNLNGLYYENVVANQNQYRGMYWVSFRKGNYGALGARMMIRPREM